jgi:hypothetical protein
MELAEKKLRIIKEIEKTDNELLIDTISSLLNASHQEVKYSFSEEQLVSLILESEEQYQKGEVFPIEEIRSEIEKWKKE